MSTSSGDGSSGYFSSGEPIEESTKLELYYIFCIGIFGLIALSAIIVIAATIVKCYKKNKKNKIRDECDEYEDILDPTILQLFKTMDKRNTKPPPPLNTSSVAETRFHSSSDSNNGHIHSHIATSTENGPSNSPHSFYELPSFEEASNRTSSIDVALLKPLGLEKFTSNDSVYDKLSEPSNSSEDIIILENTYENTAAISPRISPNHQSITTGHVYDDALNSVENIKGQQHNGKAFLTTPTVSFNNQSPSSQKAERLYSNPLSFNQKDVISEDIEGYYIIPDNFPPPSKYSSPSTRKLVLSPEISAGRAMGEVRCQQNQTPISQNGRDQNSPTKVPSIYTNIDGISPDGGKSFKDDSMSSKLKYNYSADNGPNERMLTSPNQRDSHEGDVTVEPHHDPLQKKKKFNSLPLNRSRRTTDALHTYTNVKPTKSFKNSKSGLSQENIMEFETESVNPIYSSSKKIPSYKPESLSPNPVCEEKKKTSKHTSRDDDHDYLSNTTEWLEDLRKQSSTNSIKPSSHQQIGVTSFEDGDNNHTYMGILVREREDHDYSSPKRMVSSSSASSGVKMTRTRSLDNPNFILQNKYENQAMWLPTKTPSSAKTTGFHRQNSAGYMDLLGTGYETHYTTPKMFSHSHV